MGAKSQESGDLDRAVGHYKAGIRAFMDAKKLEPNARKQQQLLEQIEKFLVKAETLKQISQGNQHSSNSQDENAAENKFDEQILKQDTGVLFDDVVGLDSVKKALTEAVILPSENPEIFKGLRKPPKGLLLFGPPGTGKTMVAKALAGESKATFFNISASSIVSKFMGEGEKKVKALFDLAYKKRPSIIFIDEIDSLLSKRDANDHEASSRLKTEFLIQMDGVGSKEGVFVLAATNLPDRLDDALLRRLTKRFYVPLPSMEARKAIVQKMLRKHKERHLLGAKDLEKIARATDGYSASDVAAVVKDAAMGPIRDIDPSVLRTLPPKKIPPIKIKHFMEAISSIEKSVSEASLEKYKKWAQKNDGVGIEESKHSRAAAPIERRKSRILASLGLC